MTKAKKIWILTPIFGSVLFVVLYIVAAVLYPGGSQIDNNSKGFSWADNYWCNLLNDNAINGQPNPGKPIAIAGMFALCLALVFFWFLFSTKVKGGNASRLIIQISGTLAMIVASLLFTSIDHDLIINIATIFGLIATVGIILGLYKTKWYGLFGLGLLNILLVGMNNYVYYNKELIIFLPVIQKISFGTFLIWICCIDMHLYLRAISTEINHDNRNYHHGD